MRHFFASGRRRRLVLHLGWLALTATLALLWGRGAPPVPEPSDGAALDVAGPRSLGGE